MGDIISGVLEAGLEVEMVLDDVVVQGFYFHGALGVFLGEIDDVLPAVLVEVEKESEFGV